MVKHFLAFDCGATSGRAVLATFDGGRFGWDYLFILMAGFAVVGGILVALLWNIKADGYIHDDKPSEEDTPIEPAQ